MKYCPRCGIEISSHIKYCPLCNSEIKNGRKKSGEINIFPKDDIGLPKVMSNKEKRRLAWHIISILEITLVLIIFSINLVWGDLNVWPAYMVLIISWIYLTISLMLFRKVNVIFFGNIITTTLFLAIIDSLNGKFEWFIPLALPIIIMITFIYTISFLFISKSKKRGMNIPAIILFDIGLFNIGLDIFISMHNKGTITPSWSIIVLASVIPLSVILFYLHYTKYGRMKKIFHA